MRFSVPSVAFVFVQILLLSVGCRKSYLPSEEIVLECEAFAETGGWTVDAQFMDQMGSPYLLAHGLGKPVTTDAKTSFVVTTPGRYVAYVRTRNYNVQKSLDPAIKEKYLMGAGFSSSAESPEH